MTRPRRNGSIIAHGREWPLYERWEGSLDNEQMMLFMHPEDEAEKFALDEEALRHHRRGSEQY